MLSWLSKHGKKQGIEKGQIKIENVYAINKIHSNECLSRSTPVQFIVFNTYSVIHA